MVSVPGVETLGKALEEGNGDFLRRILMAGLREVMDAEVSSLCQAEAGERSPLRTNHRNGYRGRDFETRLGTLDLQIPKLRRGSYFPCFLEPRRRWEDAFRNVVAEAFVCGVSTRKVEAIVEAMGAQGISKSEVSRIAQVLDAEVEAFRIRPLEASYRHLWLDAMYLKVREGGRIRGLAVLIALGVNLEGRLEVLGVDVAEGEMEDAWKAFLEGLVARGMKGIELAISDAHTGLKAALRKVLNGVSWQRCRVHFMRNAGVKLPKSVQAKWLEKLKLCFAAEGQDEALARIRALAKETEAKHPDFAKLLDEAAEDVTAFMAFPREHWRRIHSTNVLERENRELRRRTDVVGIFPNRASVLRLVGSILLDQHAEWVSAQRPYVKV
jgi:transposase-like protein